jgi:hypothetical protein
MRSHACAREHVECRGSRRAMSEVQTLIPQAENPAKCEVQTGMEERVGSK